MPVWTALKLQKLPHSNHKTGVIGLSMFDEDDLIIDMLGSRGQGLFIKEQ